MSFRLTYAEIRELVGRRVRHTRMARAVVRKGLGLMGAPASAPGAPDDISILSIPHTAYGALSAGIYWHPANLPHYVTRRGLGGATQVRVSAVLTSVSAAEVAPNATLSAVYATTLEGGGDWAPLAMGGSVGVNVISAGLYVSEWEVIPLGAKGTEVYIGLSLQVHTAIGALLFGNAEVRIR